MLNQLIIFSAQYLPFLILLIAIISFVQLEKLRKRSIGALLLISSVIAFVLDKILSSLIESPRPFVVDGVAPLFPHSISNGFPSEHALFVMIISGVVFTYNRKLGVILASLGLLVGIARVIANVHHPIDIVGGIVVALISIFCASRILSLQKIRDFLSIKIGK